MHTVKDHEDSRAADLSVFVVCPFSLQILNGTHNQNYFIVRCLLSYVVSSLNLRLRHYKPPRGWNSYDSFCWTINEEQFLQNAQAVSNRLYAHGYKYVVVDYLWYRRMVEGAGIDSLGFDVIDEWGRLAPDPSRWPTSVNGKGFTQVSAKVHSMNLKFGINVMRGISTQAYNANTPILDVKTGRAYEESGRIYTAKDIGIPDRPCSWMKNGFMSVNISMAAGRAFLRSLYVQYDHWGVEFVKHDCVFGEDLDLEEIETVSRILQNRRHDIVYSVSPGTGATPAMAKVVTDLVDMYKIGSASIAKDGWGYVVAHLFVARDFAAAGLIGSDDYNGIWADLDALPFGWVTDPPDSMRGPYRNSSLTPDQQRTQMTFWGITRAPLFLGGDVRNLDDATYDLITNPMLLEMNTYSSNNTELLNVDVGNGIRAWIADQTDSGVVYLACFNLTYQKRQVSAKVSDLAKAVPQIFGSNVSICDGREAWSGMDIGKNQTVISMDVEANGAALFLLYCF
ncbi:alpha-galactosidase-like [Tripterygium wilfordii]|uniref:alpha-galactosidase-like n=1 Tax=Tripterygium wilfordii TaxID=458696 RepID=UPI0018F84FC8|nr:alpha-galactosidase-like [Tripterygium wilfordii]